MLNVNVAHIHTVLSAKGSKRRSVLLINSGFSGSFPLERARTGAGNESSSLELSVSDDPVLSFELCRIC
ncbi:hypothetical protein GQX74_001304 [Glossina fuscipes]|uniref:Uncharacterized protein n=1 Tax=Glossina palpalis gambiensis TaxID=67801 RepID=A0A1B0AP43_9MUSC|nr:hypothetical protein GQX74_001304 [Glossina fuscipes]